MSSRWIRRCGYGCFKRSETSQGNRCRTTPLRGGGGTTSTAQD